MRASTPFAIGALGLLAACGPAAPERAAIAPIVLGLGDPALDARSRGLVLLAELGCANCHPAVADRELSPRRGPDLRQVGTRVRPDFLVRFLVDPHAADPGTTMPALLADRSPGERLAAATALAAYLRSFAAPPSAVGTTPDPDADAGDAVARGRTSFEQLGCIACHAPRDDAGRELPLPGSAPLASLAAKYTADGLRAFLLAPHDVRPDGRMPDLHLSPAEAHDLTRYLLHDALAAAPAPAVAAAETARGRALFAALRCAACHDLPDAQRADPAAAPLPGASARGCLAEQSGAAPAFELSPEQRADLAAALAPGAAASDEVAVRRLLAQQNCLACHARGTSGGVAVERTRFFRSGDPSLGEEGRLPPPLTGVGAKLQRDWLVDAIAHGQSIRPYLRARMPGFGPRTGAALGDRLATTDALPPLALPSDAADETQQHKVRDLGCDLVGDRGMNCISCHAFAGQATGAMAAVDLVDTTGQRLRREWFHRFLRAPYEFKPGTIMPQFFVDGVSTRPALGDGDPTRQIDAMWHYLAEGRNTRQPSGLRQPAIELTVGDQAVLLRRSAEGAGKRGISVGYPGGVNLVFDAEGLAVTMVWWGRFLDASGVWHSQGSGQTHPLGKPRATLPRGPVFAALPDAASPWPRATRRELDQRWLGYDLDQRQQPTFRYVCGGVEIHDAPAALPAADNASPCALRRVFTFARSGDQAATTLTLLAARDARIEVEGAAAGIAAVRVGGTLRLRLPAGSFRIVGDGAERELRVAVPLDRTGGTLTIDYECAEGGK